MKTFTDLIIAAVTEFTNAGLSKETRPAVSEALFSLIAQQVRNITFGPGANVIEKSDSQDRSKASPFFLSHLNIAGYKPERSSEYNYHYINILLLIADRKNTLKEVAHATNALDEKARETVLQGILTAAVLFLRDSAQLLENTRATRTILHFQLLQVLAELTTQLLLDAKEPQKDKVLQSFFDAFCSLFYKSIKHGPGYRDLSIRTDLFLKPYAVFESRVASKSEYRGIKSYELHRALMFEIFLLDLMSDINAIARTALFTKSLHQQIYAFLFYAKEIDFKDELPLDNKKARTAFDDMRSVFMTSVESPDEVLSFIQLLTENRPTTREAYGRLCTEFRCPDSLPMQRLPSLRSCRVDERRSSSSVQACFKMDRDKITVDVKSMDVYLAHYVRLVPSPTFIESKSELPRICADIQASQLSLCRTTSFDVDDFDIICTTPPPIRATASGMSAEKDEDEGYGGSPAKPKGNSRFRKY